MLIEFALDNSFFESDALTSKGNNRSFLEKWKNNGVLIFSQNQNEELFLEQLKKKIPPKVYQDWKDAFSENKSIHSKVSWKNFCDYSDYADLINLCSVFQTGITEDTTFEIVSNLPNYVPYCTKSLFEIIDIDDHHLSNNLKISIDHSCSDINRDLPINEVWNNKFHYLAKYCKNIVIIDRYLFKNIREDIGEGRRTSIENFLDFLKNYGKRFNITIISEGGIKDSDEKFPISNFFDKISSNEYSHCFNKIELISKKESYFQKIAHDRFVSFDKFVCDIGVGFSIFRNFSTPQSTFKMVKEDFSSIRERINLAYKSNEWIEEYLPSST